MNTQQPKQYYLTENSSCLITVTRKMVRERAAELAFVIGRSVHEVSKAEWDQAKRELMGAAHPEPDEVVAESAAESEGWGTLPGSTGYHVPIPSDDDEDNEGRSDTERLVVEGVNAAGRERSRTADRAAKL